MHEWPGQYQPKSSQGPCDTPGAVHMSPNGVEPASSPGQAIRSAALSEDHREPPGQGLGYKRKEDLHLLLSQTQSSRDLASTLKVLPCAGGCACIS